ncbi:efflux RND transporter periplasmic adaptor subunit [Leptolyngbya sp. NIES-2104]|uniref:efflux RND transporter periplasmic adaptor subunit n=1 Tax=Leptolyngbya sp. NIES-2104 TaxID=1552121 RepID=UPI0006EC9222|nr:efflux RND transporter periplasmic adaptor subunit [Leptolyngbya sp. NIES-2104]GAP98845.1 probable RND efflux membrane fusion protein [Leptolyngbya sp. NIES-2104]
MDVPRVRHPRSEKRNRLLIGLGLSALLVGGTGAFFFVRRPTSAPQQVATSTQTVSIAPVQPARISRTIDATGTVAARDLLPIAPEASGLQVQQVLANEGQTVRAGQELAILSGDVLRTQLNQAQAQSTSAQAVLGQRQATLQQQQATLTEAQSNLRRYQQLAQSGAISQADLEQRATAVATTQAAVSTAQAGIGQAQADIQASQAEIQRLQTQLNQTIVRSPTNGVIAESLAKVGDVASTMNPLFRLIREGELELQIKLPSTQLPQVREGSPVKIASDADRRINVQGTVREIAPLIDPQTRQATVKINLPQNSAIRSGLFLRAAITTQTAQALVIPSKAVLPQSSGGSTVFVLQPDGTVRSQIVQTGATQSADPNNTTVEIVQGLNAGDRVVVAGAGYLKDGDRVTVAQQ